MMYKALVFDLDDTLCNTSEIADQVRLDFYKRNITHFPGKTLEELMDIHAKAFEETARNPQIPVNTAYILFWYRVFEFLNIKPSIRVIHQFTSEMTDAFSKNVKLTQGSFDLLEYLVREKILIGILTNGTYFQQTSKLITLGIDHMIDYLVTPDMCLADKPDPKSFRYILNKLGVKPEESLMIGNNFTADIAGAKRVGMDAIYLDLGTDEKKDEVKPDLIVTSLRDLITWLDR